MKLTNVMIAALLTVTAVQAKSVKSKRGALEIRKAQTGADIECSVSFGEEMNVVKEDGVYVLVKSSGCQGWLDKSSVEYVAQVAGDQDMNLDNIDIVGWMDDPSAVFVLDNNVDDADGVNMDRNFNEMLTHTLDRERTEFSNGEN